MSHSLSRGTISKPFGASSSKARRASACLPRSTASAASAQRKNGRARAFGRDLRQRLQRLLGTSLLPAEKVELGRVGRRRENGLRAGAELESSGDKPLRVVQTPLAKASIADVAAGNQRCEG